MLAKSIEFYKTAKAFLPRYQLLRNDGSAPQVCEFIEAGYKDRFDASIKVSMPYILRLSFLSKHAAMGVRSANSPLFIEQYLDKPIEDYTQQYFAFNDRRKIVEYGSLYSNGHKLATPLFMLSTLALMKSGVQALAFCATQGVANILKAYGLTLTHLVKADPSKLATSNNDWGRYYDTKPQVYLLSLPQVAHVVSNTPKYAHMFKLISPSINKLAAQISKEALC
jgi:hypothetical protein